MRSNRKLLVGIAIILAAIVILEIGMWVLHNSSGSKTTNVAANTAPAPGAGVTPVALPAGSRMVAQAAQDLPAGTIIAPGMFVMKPSSKASDNVSGFINDPKDALGYITRVPLRKGSSMRPEDMVGHITEVGIAGAIRPGMRAMSIAIPNKPTIHDLVKVGNYVDVIAAFQGKESRPVVENVRVMAVDLLVANYPPTNGAMTGPYAARPKGNIMPGTEAPPPGPGGEPGPTPTPTAAPQQNPAPPAAALTLEVTPQQANILLLTQASGASFDFILRPASPDLTPEGAITTEDTVPVSEKSVTIPQIAPYNERLRVASVKKESEPLRNMGRDARAALKDFANGAKDLRYAGMGGPESRGGTGTGTSGSPGTLPAFVPTPAPPATYDIPIYGDGKLVRTDTVRNPAAYQSGQ